MFVGNLYDKSKHEKVELNEDCYRELYHKHVNLGKPVAQDPFCYLQACFVMLVVACKTLNEQAQVLSKLSQPSMPVLLYPVRPDQALPQVRAQLLLCGGCLCYRQEHGQGGRCDQPCQGLV